MSTGTALRDNNLMLQVTDRTATSQASDRHTEPVGELWTTTTGRGRIKAFTLTELSSIWTYWIREKDINRKKRFGQYVWERWGYDGAWAEVYFSAEAYQLLFNLWKANATKSEKAAEGYSV